MLLVNVLLKFQNLKTEICQYFLLKKCEKLFVRSFCSSLIFSTTNISVFGYKVVKHLTSFNELVTLRFFEQPGPGLRWTIKSNICI